MSKKRDPELVILEYLEEQNRPYSAVDIFNNLHKEFGKTAVEKTLEILSDDKQKIVKKTYGKQKVYAPSQDQYGEYNEMELKELDLKIKQLQEEVNTFTSKVKKQESEISGLNSQMKTEEALELMETTSVENMNLKKRIEKLSTGAPLITQEQKQKIFERKSKNIGHWRKRKRMTNDVLDCILEGYPKAKKDLLEETGVETDEDVGIKIPS